MDGPIPPASAAPDPPPGSVADRAWPPAVLTLPRPDGGLQVGLGPGAWLVRGWSTGSPSVHGLVQALAAGPPGVVGEVPRPPCRVVGHGLLARRLRERLASGEERGSQDGVVVLVCEYAVPVGTARRGDLAAAPVLPVVAQTHRVVVGPWVGLPGGPCLHCLDLHRTDADPTWSVLASALDDPTVGPSPRHAEDVLGLVAALTALLVDGLGRDGRDERGLAYEVGSHRPHLVLRRWPAHPACPWHPG